MQLCEGGAIRKMCEQWEQDVKQPSGRRCRTYWSRPPSRPYGRCDRGRGRRSSRQEALPLTLVELLEPAPIPTPARPLAAPTQETGRCCHRDTPTLGCARGGCPRRPHPAEYFDLYPAVRSRRIQSHRGTGLPRRLPEADCCLSRVVTHRSTALLSARRADGLPAQGSFFRASARMF
jgi:hypothetical protein